MADFGGFHPVGYGECHESDQIDGRACRFAAVGGPHGSTLFGAAIRRLFTRPRAVSTGLGGPCIRPPNGGSGPAARRQRDRSSGCLHDLPDDVLCAGTGGGLSTACLHNACLPLVESVGSQLAMSDAAARLEATKSWN